ncbi:CPBP family intramembrane glutamic endopeptidase [Nocardioides panacisoli]|uniref:CPBP family intramembrane metalloprotease n=1 Tax=Nocardioides panacisoli TaxID=627624 RepID=A0ABP7I464_9ACTN
MNRVVRPDRRRRRIAAATLAAGAGLLGASLSAAPGSRRFYGLTLATAGTWVAGGALSGAFSRAEPSQREPDRRLVPPVAVAGVAFGGFCGGALVARRIPPLGRAVDSALGLAGGGSLPLVLLTTAANGIGEEVFFRGAVFDLAGRRPVVASTATYALVTATTRNPALVLAAAVMGALFGWQRRATGSLRAPTVTHLTWSLLMVTVLPRVLRRPCAGR